MIPRADIDRVLDATPILPLAIQYLPKLRRSGRQWFALCPIHKERSPSFAVDPDKGLFHCHGCKCGGNAIDLVMMLERISFPSAVRLLADRAGVRLSDEPNSNRDAYVAQIAAECSWFWSHARRRYSERQTMCVTLRNAALNAGIGDMWAHYRRRAGRWHRIIARLDAAPPDKLLVRYVGIRQRWPGVVGEYRREMEAEREWRGAWAGWMAELGA